MKTVTIFRTEGFFANSQPGAKQFLSNAKMSIGAYWASSSSKGIGTGLTPSEVILLLPLILDIHSEDRDFRKEVRSFYEALTTKVTTLGIQLNIELEDETKPLGKNNLPKEPMNYIRYKHALSNPEVAIDKESSIGNYLKKYYVHDPSKVSDVKAETRKQKDLATKAYISINENEIKVDNVLALLGQDPRMFKDFEDKISHLQAEANSGSTEKLLNFIRVVEDTQLETKAFIKKLVITNILKTVGTRYMIAENSQIIGDDLEETVFELNDTVKNSELLIVLKAKLQDEMKKKSALKK